MIPRWLQRLTKAEKEPEGVTFEDLWGPEKPGDVSDNIFTEETKDPDKKYAVVHGVGDIDTEGDVPGVIKKGLGANVADAIHDLQEAQAALSEIGDSLDNVGKASSCQKCGGKVSMAQRATYPKLMAARGWTPKSHRQFWSRVSTSDDKGGSGGHRACVAHMSGKVDDEHSFCSWAEYFATGEFPDEHAEQAVQNVRKASAELARQTSELRKALRSRR
jgi:hypothetical protein